jgi:hypothetical protein
MPHSSMKRTGLFTNCLHNIINRLNANNPPIPNLALTAMVRATGNAYEMQEKLSPHLNTHHTMNKYGSTILNPDTDGSHIWDMGHIGMSAGIS